MRERGNTVNCGYLDNICFDFVCGSLPVDEILNNEMGLFDGLSWREEAEIKKWYNMALKYGAGSVYHLKLAYTVADIIKKYFDGAKWHNKSVKFAWRI